MIGINIFAQDTLLSFTLSLTLLHSDFDLHLLTFLKFISEATFSNRMGMVCTSKLETKLSREVRCWQKEEHIQFWCRSESL